MSLRQGSFPPPTSHLECKLRHCETAVSETAVSETAVSLRLKTVASPYFYFAGEAHSRPVPLALSPEITYFV